MMTNNEALMLGHQTAFMAFNRYNEHEVLTLNGRNVGRIQSRFVDGPKNSDGEIEGKVLAWVAFDKRGNEIGLRYGSPEAALSCFTVDHVNMR